MVGWLGLAGFAAGQRCGWLIMWLGIYGAGKLGGWLVIHMPRYRTGYMIGYAAGLATA